VRCSVPLLPPAQSSPLGCRPAAVAAPPPASPSSTRRPSPILALFPSLLPSRAHATASRAARRPPRRRRHDQCPRLLPLLFSSAQQKQEITEMSFASLAPLPCTLRALIAAAARSFPPVNHWPPWAAAIGHPLPPLTPQQAFPTSTCAPQPPVALQFQPEHPHRRPPSAAASCSPWAAHSEPSRATTTHQPALHQPREAPRPFNWSPRAPHRLPDEFPAISIRRRSASSSTHCYRALQPSPGVPAAPHHPAEAS
jgi:hypothetical protein